MIKLMILKIYKNGTVGSTGANYYGLRRIYNCIFKWKYNILPVNTITTEHGAPTGEA